MPKVIKKLTEKEVRNSRPKSKLYRLYDEGGLRLLVRPTGTKVWQYPYTFHGKANIYTIGKYEGNGRTGTVSMAEARKARDEVKELISQGIDPNKHKALQRFASDEKSKTTFEAVAREWHSKGTWVPKHAKNIIRTLERDVFPLIGSKQIDQINARDIIHVLSTIEARDATDVAKRTAQRCEAIFDYALLKGLCDNNPASGRSKYIKPRKTQHRPHLKEHELPAFLNKLDHYRGRAYIRLALHVLVLTFVRPGELRNARWHEIDRKNAIWRIPAQRMKMNRDHLIPLSMQALNVLAELKDIIGDKSELLFPSIRSSQKPISDVTLLKALKILGYEGDNKITPHGFRHTASTILNEHRFDRDVIERQLAHVDSNKIRGIYNHAEYLPERKRMMQWYADHLDKLKQQKLKSL